MGLEVRYLDLPSLEGMYVKEHKLLLLPALRPAGRRAFAAAHEIGHFLFGHGTWVDCSSDAPTPAANEPEEFLADSFAGFLLMPKPAVITQVKRLVAGFGGLEPLVVYRISSRFGVGYETLLAHLHRSLRLIGAEQFSDLGRERPASVRREILGSESGSNLVWADTNWSGRPIDAAVGDDVLLPRSTRIESACLARVGGGLDGFERYRATRSGIGRVTCGEWSSFLRVAKANYVGRAVHRHLEDPDD
jgi:hypothetical protein